MSSARQQKQVLQTSLPRLSLGLPQAEPELLWSAGVSGPGPHDLHQ